MCQVEATGKEMDKMSESLGWPRVSPGMATAIVGRAWSIPGARVPAYRLPVSFDTVERPTEGGKR